MVWRLSCWQLAAYGFDRNGVLPARSGLSPRSLRNRKRSTEPNVEKGRMREKTVDFPRPPSKGDLRTAGRRASERPGQVGRIGP